MRFSSRSIVVPLACAAAVLLSSCGGDDGGGQRYFSCTPGNEKSWLRAYMNDLYFWAGKSPDPAPGGYATINDYLDARRFQGNATDPADRFSYIESQGAFEQFFVEGQTLGYGVSVNGVEAQLPLKIRYVDPGSPAANANLLRGDTLVSVNGVTAAQLVQSGNYGALSPAAVGNPLTLEVTSGGSNRTVVLSAANYALVPVTAPTVFPIAGGRKAGYLSLKDFVTQAEGPLSQAIADIRAQGATELILDLRYNGGGRVSTATHLASLVTGATHAGKTFTDLVYNDYNPGYDSRYRLSSKPGAAFPRVVILTGSRTCSASEMVANGLKPYATVVTIGTTSCGKPVGFSPETCNGNVYSIVNFESLNANGQGKYYNGLPVTCVVTDDFSRSLGDPAEKLTAAALSYVENGACPAGVTAAPSSTLRISRTPVAEPGQRSGMFAD